jgi:hypothetical protein
MAWRDLLHAVFQLEDQVVVRLCAERKPCEESPEVRLLLIPASIEDDEVVERPLSREVREALLHRLGPNPASFSYAKSVVSGQGSPEICPWYSRDRP